MLELLRRSRDRPNAINGACNSNNNNNNRNNNNSDSGSIHPTLPSISLTARESEMKSKVSESNFKPDYNRSIKSDFSSRHKIKLIVEKGATNGAGLGWLGWAGQEGGGRGRRGSLLLKNKNWKQTFSAGFPGFREDPGYHTHAADKS